MAYCKEREQRLKELLEEIEGRKSHSNAAATYRDAPALREIVKTVETQLAEDEDKSSMTDSIAVLTYAADRYSSLGRFVLSAELYGRVLELALKLWHGHGADTKNAKDILYLALQARNYYVDDDCDDLVMIGKELLEEGCAEKMQSERRAHRRSLKHDPVEMTGEYLRVIDAVEKQVEENRTVQGHGSCYEAWSLKKKYLSEYGIAWRSVHELNPRMHFD